jgi:ATP-dependent RNA helicase MSS116
MASGDLLLRAHAGAPVLARAFPCRLRVPARHRRGLVCPLAAARVDVAGRVRPVGAAPVQKRRLRDAEERISFSRVVTRRDAVDDDEEDVEGEAPQLGAVPSGGDAGGVDGSYLSDTR